MREFRLLIFVSLLLIPVNSYSNGDASAILDSTATPTTTDSPSTSLAQPAIVSTPEGTMAVAAGPDVTDAPVRRVRNWWDRWWFEVVLSLLSTTLGVVVALWYENLGAPRLFFEVSEPNDAERPQLGRVKFLYFGRPQLSPQMPTRASTHCPWVPRPHTIPNNGRSAAHSSHGHPLGRQSRALEG